MPRRLWPTLAVTALLAVVLLVPAARSDGTPTADLVASLSGPNSGKVGDTLTFTVTVTNKGPDDGVANVWFAMQKNAGLSPLDWSPACSSNDTPDQWIMACNNTSVPVGGTFQLTVHVRVDAIKETTVDGLAGPNGVNDPDTSNNAASFPVFPATPPPPPPPPPPQAPPYTFVDTLPHATQYRLFSFATIQCDLSSVCPTRVEISTGNLPPGVQSGGDVIGSIVGTPTTPGTYTFTLTAVPPDGANLTAITHQYTLIVDPLRDTTGAGPAPILPRSSLTPGSTNPLVKQATIRSTICTPSWASTVRPPASFLTTLKLKQMKQYGDSGRPGAYREDHLIPIELGGAPRSPKNLWPEPVAHAKRADQLEHILRGKVCAGSLSLTSARKRILSYKRTNG